DGGGGVQPQVHSGGGDHPVEIAQGFVELLLAGDAAGDVELAADAVLRLVEVDGVTALGQVDRGREPGRTGPDDGDAFGAAGRREHQFGLVPGARVEQAGHPFVAEGVVEAG